MENTLEFQQVVQQMDAYGHAGTPFFFVWDFEGKKPLLFPLFAIDPTQIQFTFPGMSKPLPQLTPLEYLEWELEPMGKEEYHKRFLAAHKEMLAGNSQLLSLTFPTRIHTNASLLELFQITQAPYKLWIKDTCTVFSPEAFVRINQETISTFPMKGTRTQAEYKQRSLLLDDPRENAEHATIVDVLRTDLARIADEVELVKYRYVDQVTTAAGQLLQTSSVIQGQIKDSLKRSYGTILSQIFPPGSVSGSPKDKSIHIIRRIEGQPRGYYTGIMGYFDGLQMDSAVLIRFVEQTPDGHFFRSGAGITMRSEWLAEYQEMLAKCQLPLAREHRHLMQGALV